MSTQPRRPDGYPATPNLDKMAEAKEKLGTEHVGAFLEWLRKKRNLGLCARAPRYDPREDDRWLPSHDSIENLLARYAGVDLDACERERTAILSWVRKHPSARTPPVEPALQNIAPRTEEGDKVRAALREEHAIQAGSLDRLRALTDEESVARDQALELVLKLLREHATKTTGTTWGHVQLGDKIWRPEDVLRLLEIVVNAPAEYVISYFNMAGKKPNSRMTFSEAFTWAQERVNRSYATRRLRRREPIPGDPLNGKPYAVLRVRVIVAVVYPEEK